MKNFFDYAARHNLALFPCAAGSKMPVSGINWTTDASHDPAQWETWRATGYNVGINAAQSDLIVVDVDAARVGRDDAWAAWVEICKSWGLPGPLAPACQSARGGWHTYVRRPTDADPAALRGTAVLVPDADGHEIIGARVRGYAVAPGSHYNGSTKGEASGDYLMMHSAPPPHAAPVGLVEALRRPVVMTTTGAAGESDPVDLAALVSFLAAHGEFAEYSDWVACGMACKLAAGDDGLAAWALAHDGTVTPEVESDKWKSFTSEPRPGDRTIGSLIGRARSLGWNGAVRRTTQAMFSGVATSIVPQLPVGAMPMMQGQVALAEVATPIVEAFLAVYAGEYLVSDAPRLPDNVTTTPALAAALNKAVSLLMRRALRSPSAVRVSECGQMLAVLRLIHSDTSEKVLTRIRDAGVAISDGRIAAAVKFIESQVRRETRLNSGFICNARTGVPEADNSDNTLAFVRMESLEMRSNLWLRRVEICGGLTGDDWRPLDDIILGALLTRAEDGHYQYRPPMHRFLRHLETIAGFTTYHPVREYIDACETEFGNVRGEAEMMLIRACAVHDNPYHRAVALNVLGGIVKRVRRPGCKHDEALLLIGPENTYKSTMAKVLALRDEWFSDNVDLDQSPQNAIPAMFGKLVIEFGEIFISPKRAEAAKKFISSTDDDFVLKYEKLSASRPRQSIFFCTSNRDQPLSDPTGNRRFLPVRIAKRIDIAWLRENLRRLIGEVARREREGELFLIGDDILDAAMDAQASALRIDDAELQIEQWFGEKDGPKAFITAGDFVALARVAGWRNGHEARGAAMRRAGFECYRLSFKGNRIRIWLRAPAPLTVVDGLPRYVVFNPPGGIAEVKLLPPGHHDYKK